MPQGRTEDRIQLANTFNWIVPDKAGSHSFKAGVDASFIDLFSEFHNNLDGTFTFTTSTPFDPAVASTYPTQYTGNIGDPIVNLNNNIYAAFVQDQWQPGDRLTINLGRALGLRRRRRHRSRQEQLRAAARRGVGPQRLRADGAARQRRHLLRPDLPEHPAQRREREEVRADADLEPGLSRSERAESQPHRRTDHADPELDAVCAREPDALYRSRSRPASSVRLAARSRFQPTWSAPAASACCDRATPTTPTWTIRRARGRIRSFQRITIVETKGNSWYTGLQVGIEKRLSQHHTYTVAYTLSETERNTEDFNFFPVDNRFYDLERGPASNDSRHRVSAAFTRAIAVADPGRHADRGQVDAALQRHDRRRRQPRHANQRSARRRRPQLRPRRHAVPGRSSLDQDGAACAAASDWS